jgi:glycosyltransferase involved in cell wall biosynthesis
MTGQKSKKSQKRITVSVISNLATDQRVIRISSTLQEMGFEVIVFYRNLKGNILPGSYHFRYQKINCFFRKGVLQYAEFNCKLFFRLLFCKTDYFLANDLDTLAPNYLASKLRRKYLFYDTHEYFTGVPELKNAPVKRKTWKLLEDWIFPKLKTVYTVNESVRDQYQAEYGNTIGIVRNVPVTVQVQKKAMPMHWQNKVIMMMQGIGINEGRGGLELLESMRHLPEQYHLVFIGSGNNWQQIAQKRRSWQLEEKVEMINPLPPAELKQYTLLAYIGYSLDNFSDLNCRFNLPNKIFDYIHAGVPVIATAIPEVKKIIEQYQCGICINTNDPEEIASATKKLTENTVLYHQLKRNTVEAAKELCWEKEKNRLIAIYEKYL